MKAVDLRSERLLLDQPTLDDVDLIARYCTDPLFEEYLTTPWPYTRDHAVGFVTRLVPDGWSRKSEFTWAIRHAEGADPEADDGELLGVIGWRSGGHDVGFWLGAPHRGNGYMPEALNAVLDWVFLRGEQRVVWECIEGNVASLTVARKVGFRFTGNGPSLITGRDGTHPPAWHAEIAASDPRRPRPGWPEA
jgi:RimJ/RimL family protein N-acetyltransferase